jgi:hypothetical protein
LLAPRAELPQASPFNGLECQTVLRARIAAVTKAVAAGHITPSEAAEIAKVIDAYVKAYQTAELDERVAHMERLSDAELMRIAMGGYAADGAAPVCRLLTVAPR